MSTLIARCLVLGGAAMLAASPAMAQSSAEERSGRSPGAQADDQTTRQGESQFDQQPSSRQQGQDWQDNQREGLLGRFRDSDEPSRREMRQEDRQERRQAMSDREPAIGVTVVERGGLGVRVVRVVAQSPAAQAGIRPGDTILEVDGRGVGTPQDLVAVIQENEAGETAELAIIRSGREYQVPVRLATREQALPPQVRRQGEGQFGRRTEESGQYGQTWQQGAYDQQQQQLGQTGQYEQQRPWDQQQGQYGQQQGRFAQQPDSAQRYSDQYSGSTQQAYYGAPEQGYTEQERRAGAERDWQLGDRLIQRLERLENRIDRLAQRVENLQRERAEQPGEARQNFEDDQDVSRQADRRTEE